MSFPAKMDYENLRQHAEIIIYPYECRQQARDDAAEVKKVQEMLAKEAVQRLLSLSQNHRRKFQESQTCSKSRSTS